MSQSVRFALALVILWMAFAAFFVAFHPGGIQLNGHEAQNPSDVMKYLIEKMSKPTLGTQTGSTGGTVAT